jgi:hypothetical protein
MERTMKTFPTRDAMVASLPKGGWGVEVGVQAGVFSEALLGIAQPDILFLVDRWQHQPDGPYSKDPANVSQDAQNALHNQVKARFARTRRAVIVRQDSVSAANRCMHGTLAWVYLDADHTYESVLADLRAWAPKVQRHGRLMGHDYTDRAEAIAMGFGVVAAVNDFCRDHHWEIVALTDDDWPSYMLKRKIDR